MSVLLRNIKLVDSRREHKGEILVENGVIAAVGNRLNREADHVIDGGGKILMPAFVDLHAHFRDPGLTQKEDILTGSKAAVRGGYTTVNLMANTKPVCSSMQTVDYVRQKAREIGLCDVYQTVSITENFDGATLTHIDKLDSSIRWLSDDGCGIRDTGVMLEAMRKAKERGFGVMLHEEEPALTKENPYLAENLMTFRDLQLAAYTGCRTHICHVSTIDALNYVLAAKERSDFITCEVSPHHLLLSDTTDYRVAPPLRREEHRQYLIAGIRKGVVDAIATDHAPHTPADKQAGANGITGLDLAFSACYTALVKEGHISMKDLSRVMSYNPAKILGVPKGLLDIGYPADFVLVNADAVFTVTEDRLASKSKNTPLLGRVLCGEILMTMKQGEIGYEKADKAAV